MFVGTRGPSVNVYPIGYSEEQLIGVNQFGYDYVCPYLVYQPPNPPPQYLHDRRLMVGQNATFFEFEGAGLPVVPVQLPNAGDVYHIETSEGFGVSAAKPVGLLVHMQEENNGDGGYPESHLVIPPIEDFLDRYVIYNPSFNNMTHVLTVVRPVNSTTAIDGVDEAPIETDIVITGWQMVEYTISSGVHEVTGSEPFLAVVSGWGQQRNYMYFAGMAL
jgi:hypothetical protein